MKPEKPSPGAHVVPGPGNNQMRCLRCGNVQTIALPCSIAFVAAIAKAYDRAHRRCKAKGASA